MLGEALEAREQTKQPQHLGEMLWLSYAVWMPEGIGGTTVPQPAEAA